MPCSASLSGNGILFIYSHFTENRYWKFHFLSRHTH
jgi:hypothetical protein